MSFRDRFFLYLGLQPRPFSRKHQRGPLKQRLSMGLFQRISFLQYPPNHEAHIGTTLAAFIISSFYFLQLLFNLRHAAFERVPVGRATSSNAWNFDFYDAG